MPVDPKIVDARQEPFTLLVERGRARAFAQSIGETNPIYLDGDAARAAGHPDVLVAPTFLFGLELENSDTFEVLERHGVALSSVLHGEQTFDYHHLVHAGDIVTFESRFTETYSKSGGALEFIVRETEATRADGVRLVTMKSLSVVRVGDN